MSTVARRRQHKPGTLKDLIDANLLKAGEELVCEPRKGEYYTATLVSDGSIIYDGTSFQSPTSWANHVSGTSLNGWEKITARGKSLKYFREQLNSTAESQSDIGDDKSDFVNAVVERNTETQTTQETHLVESEVVATPSRVSPGNAHSEEARIQSEISNLKAQVASQQSVIAEMNAKIDNLPASQPEEDTKDDVIGYLRERVLSLEPSEFETLVGEYLKAKGFSNVVVSGRSGDGGIDGECDIPFINVKVAFQAKRYADANNIGIEPVQRLQGSMTGRFDRGIFITTSDYTPAARGWVEEVQAQITLINGDELMKEMVDLGLGVKAVAVVKHELNEGFFADLESK